MFQDVMDGKSITPAGLHVAARSPRFRFAEQRSFLSPDPAASRGVDQIRPREEGPA
jgi:hypothetical protein